MERERAAARAAEEAVAERARRRAAAAALLPQFVDVAPASFVMGARGGEGHPDERPPHTVKLTRSFSIASLPVTQGLYRAVTGENPSHFKPRSGEGAGGRDLHPVERLSWVDAARFCNALSELFELTPAYTLREDESPSGWRVEWDRAATGYRLPTEAEWELAAGAQESHRFSGSADVNAVAWHGENADGATHPVGQKAPNAWGLYDCSGNVWEWVYDAWAPKAYAERERVGVAVDPVSEPAGQGQDERAARGGSWFGEHDGCRVSYRASFELNYRVGNLGLRLAAPASGPVKGRAQPSAQPSAVPAPAAPAEPEREEGR